MSNDDIKITSPWNGDIVNRHDGTETADSLAIEVKGTAPGGAKVTVNGIDAAVEGSDFTCAVHLTHRRNEITAEAVCNGDKSADSILVLWDKASKPRYRFSVDDNIEFLRDLGTHPDDYDSLFDHWYLAFWKSMHEKYGAKIHINTYYESEDHSFNTTQVPAKWIDDWAANSDWLHLSFHAIQNFPNRIYKDATYEQMAHDYDLVVGQIKRYAGESVLTTETTVHWAEAPKDACRALHDRGLRQLIGIFHSKSGKPVTTGYYFPDETSQHIAKRDYFYDPETDLLFIECDQVVNGFQVDAIGPWLDQQAASPHTGELIELLIHEQYFRKELSNYQPTIMDKVETALTWVTERGYEPTFWSTGFAGNPTKF